MAEDDDSSEQESSGSTALWQVIGVIVGIIIFLVRCGSGSSGTADRQQADAALQAIQNLENASRMTMTQVAFVGNGPFLAVSDTYRIRVYDVSTPGRRVLTADLTSADEPKVIQRMAASRDGQLLVAGDLNGPLLHLWQLPERPNATYSAHSMRGQTGGTSALAFSADGQVLLSGSDDEAVRLWRTGDRAVALTLIGRGGTVNDVALAPDGKTVASADETIRLWDLETGTLARTLAGHTSFVRAVAYSPDGTTIGSGSADTTIRLWRAADGSPVRTLSGHSAAVSRILFSPDGQTLASASDDRTVRLWRLADGALLHTLSGHEGAVTDVAFSGDGKTLASAASQYSGRTMRRGIVRLWRMADGALLDTIDDQARPSASPSPSPSPSPRPGQ